MEIVSWWIHARIVGAVIFMERRGKVVTARLTA